jgi:thiamine-monophosphate kinase
MRISEIGEFGLIKRFRKLIRTDSSVIKASGDDCAVIKFDQNKYLLATCDMIVEGVDFTSVTDPYLIGRKALAVSISDIAACAGIPRYCLVSLGLPKKISVKATDRILKGIIDLARFYKVNIVGGDLSSASKITIDVSMLGFVEKRNLILRSGAKEGDIIFVTGKLGGSIRGKHLRFIPRLKEARFLVRNFKINSMIDISDGLAQDLGHILEESSKGAIIYGDFIPISKQAANLKEALFMGEDFELLFTLSQKEAKKIWERKLINDFKPIGQIAGKKMGLCLLDKKNRIKIIKAKGFQHFENRV